MGQTVDLSETGKTQTLLVPDEDYARFWDQIEEELDKVPHIWDGLYTKEYLRTVPLHKELLVWGTFIDGAVVSLTFARFIYGPRGKGLQFTLMLGNHLDESLETMVPTFEKIALDHECDYAEIIGRPGWERKLKNFKRDYVVLSRQLRNFRVQ